MASRCTEFHNPPFVSRRRIIILGSTGSIGTQTLEVIRENPERFEVVGLSARTNEKKLNEQAKEWNVARTYLGEDEEALAQFVTETEADLMMVALSGAVGVEPTIAALRSGKDVALANKETLVMEGDLVMKEAERSGRHLIPVDSEHSALFQLLRAIPRDKVDRLILPCSGGPFFGKSRRELEEVTVEQALDHPKWSMGKKISIDSATLVNKGFEVIEAHHLFNMPYDRIDVVIHPECTVHGMVKLKDGTTLVHTAPPDMRLPIRYALGFPDASPSPQEKITTYKASKKIPFEFHEPDHATFPGLRMGYRAGRDGAEACRNFVRANDAAVHAFLEGKIKFTEICEAPRKFALLLAAGKSSRTPNMLKQHALIGENPLFFFSLKMLAEKGGFEKIVVGVDQKNKREVDRRVAEWGFENVMVVIGGTTRQKSMQRCMAALQKTEALQAQDLIVVHNAANPFLSLQDLTRVVAGARKYGAAACGHPATDTLKEVHRGRIVRTVDRANVWHMQTPQAFRYELYAKAKTRLDQQEFTDEMSWAEAVGISPLVVLANPLNRKVTTLEEVEWARHKLAPPSLVSRTGIGQDSHRFDAKQRGLTLGGVHFPDHAKTQANSDGDVMLHALCNALLQAVGEGSFSAVADPLCARGITDSRVTLKKILKKVHAKKFTVAHVGFQLEGSTPRIDPLVPQLKASLSTLLTLAPKSIGITATTGEDLTPFGRGEGLQCFAVVTLHA